MDYTKKLLFYSQLYSHLIPQLTNIKNNYYEGEGDLLFKIRGFYLNTSAKLTKLTSHVANRPKPK